jgi:hypothetical protein
MPSGVVANLASVSMGSSGCFAYRPMPPTQNKKRRGKCPALGGEYEETAMLKSGNFILTVSADFPNATRRVPN